ncbi:hypothetical protein IBT54_000227 [Pantoea sp. S62]|nr:hypothetical protein [Pantoea sp. S62]
MHHSALSMGCARKVVRSISLSHTKKVNMLPNALVIISVKRGVEQELIRNSLHESVLSSMSHAINSATGTLPEPAGSVVSHRLGESILRLKIITQPFR